MSTEHGSGTAATPDRSFAKSNLRRFNQAVVDLTSWLLPSLAGYDEDLCRKILAAVSEAIDLSLQDGLVASFAPDIADEALNSPCDPLRIYLELPLGRNDLENPLWAFSICDAVQSALSASKHSDPNARSTSNRRLRQIREAMVELVHRIDGALYLTSNENSDNQYQELTTSSGFWQGRGD